MAVVDELTAEIHSAVLRLVAEICLREHGATQRLGLGATDVRFLTLLDVHGPLTPGRLATLTGLTTGSVTGVIDRLERADLVSRYRDGADRRKVQVVLMPEATARLAAERHDNLDLLDNVLARRDPAELAVIARFLGEVVAGYGDDQGRDGQSRDGQSRDGHGGAGRPAYDRPRDGHVRREPLRDAGSAGRGPR